MYKGFIKTAAILGALSVALGAFAAHTLKQNISEDALNIFEMGVRYQFYHVFALLFTAILYQAFNKKILRTAGSLFITGIILFSGSLYLLVSLQKRGTIRETLNIRDHPFLRVRPAVSIEAMGTRYADDAPAHVAVNVTGKISVNCIRYCAVSPNGHFFPLKLEWPGSPTH